jgi:hypothetical protein
MNTFGVPELIFTVLLVAFIIVPYWKIFQKAGFSKWLSLWMIIPGLNVIFIYYLAFTRWPTPRSQIDKLANRWGD